ncbi:FMN-binding protein [Anaerotignum sp.]
MGSTKFVVVKAKELIKTAVFAVLGVIIIVGLITFFLHMGDDENTGMYRDGTYYGEMETGGEVTEIAVVIENGEIADVSVEETTEAVAVFYPLLETAVEEVGQGIVATQSLTVEVAPENAYSAQLVLDAVAECLEKAEK